MKIETTLEEMKAEYYNWQEAIKVASRDGMRALGDDVSNKPFTIDDVEEVIGSVEGENDEEDWIAVFRLKDRRYAFLKAGCDYTGWG